MSNLMPSLRASGEQSAGRASNGSFLVVAAAMAVLVGGSNIRTPLFPLYEREYHFESATLTVLFCTYVFALIPSLLALGALSDRVGREPVIASGLALTACSSIAFAAAQGLAWLFVGEALYGVASGLVSSAAAAALRELHRTGDSRGSALGASLAPAMGLALGPLVSGALASLTPWPTVSPYALDVLLVAVLLAVMVSVPETRPSGASRGHGSVVHVPHDTRGLFAWAATVSFTAWAITGWLLALSPMFLGDELDVHRPVLGGGVVAAFFLASAGTQLVVRRWRQSRAMRTALGLELRA